MRAWLIIAAVATAIVPTAPALAVPTSTQRDVEAYCRAVGGTFWHFGDEAWGCARRCPKDKARSCGPICVADQGCEYINELARYTKVRDVRKLRRDR